MFLGLTSFCNLVYLYIFQLADAKDVVEAIRDVEGARFPVLTPNLKVRIFQ